MTASTLLTSAAALTLMAAGSAGDPPAGVLPTERPIDLAICLDTSGSMKDLLDAARNSIWAIVNDLALSKPTPKLRIALLTFGNDSHPKEDGWVRLDVPLTDDLDAVSQQLFALTTGGGTEYVGRVMQTALDQLDWSRAPNALKFLVVAGNESADQDVEVPFRAMCKRAIERDILVNSIYCGNPGDNLAPDWRQVASLADGCFAAIDKSRVQVALATPFDDQMTALSGRLNKTYLPYGEGGRDAAANQVRQDKNAAGLSKVTAATRALTKCTVNYLNSSWDLVDACRTKAIEIAKIAEKDLPACLRKMSVEERVKHIAELQKQRDAIQREIKDLHAKRAAWRVQHRAEQSTAPGSFDQAVRGAVRCQAEARGQRYAKPAPATETSAPVSRPPAQR